MRIIDADEIKIRLPFTLPPYNMMLLRNSIRQGIQDTPTVEAEPVRHGHWTRKLDTRFGPLLNDMLYCSECGVAFSTDYLIRNSFCPNCGAKMDGKRVTVRAEDG